MFAVFEVPSWFFFVSVGTRDGLSSEGLEVNLLEGVVCGFVAASSLAPAVDNSHVVSENLEMNIGGSGVEDGTDEELKSNALGPSNIVSAPILIWS